MKVGILVRLKLPCLGNPAGAKGVVYDIYKVSLEPAASIIFENGHYDGFDIGEQRQFITVIGANQKVARYHFINVFQLGKDYEAGFFSQALGGE